MASGGEFRFEWNQAGFEHLIKGRDGPVYLDLSRRAFKVRGRAVALCPVDTGRLRDSINVLLGEDEEGPYADIGTNVEYAIFVHEGTIYVEPRPFLTDALPAAG